jgi:hypothetical protein
MRSRIALQIICALFILLFGYAASTKIADYDTFRAQIGQSSLITNYADVLSWLIPAIEFLIVILLLFRNTQRLGLYMSTSLMLMFVLYIGVILVYDSNVPCSCGGIIAKMNWGQHLLFNCVFLLLGIVAIFLANKTAPTRVNLIVPASIIGLSSVVPMTLLFYMSDLTKDTRQVFSRSFRNDFVGSSVIVDLTYNSYYIAGGTAESIFLGNYMNPDTLVVIDPPSAAKRTISINGIEKGRPLPFPTAVKVEYPDIFVLDGKTPRIYSGTVDLKSDTWMVRPFETSKLYFYNGVPVSRSTLLVQALGVNPRGNVLGRISTLAGDSSIVSHHILEKQNDGIFCTAGRLKFDKNSGLAVFTYAHRNEYILLDTNLSVVGKGRTLDTVTTSRVGSQLLASHSAYKINTPLKSLNVDISLRGRYLFIRSGSIAKNESVRIFNAFTTIDVYDISERSYRFSFHLPAHYGKKPTSLFIHDQYAAAVYERQLFIFRLNSGVLNQHAFYRR